MNVKGSTYPLLSTATAVPLGDDGVFYHVAPDLAITQVMFMGGITVALLGLLDAGPVLPRRLPRAPRRVSRTGRWLCVAGVALLAAGVAAAATGFALAGTAQLAVSGWAIPALHDAASDQPIPYTPDCAGTSFKVCVHPAFSGFLAARTRRSSRSPPRSRACLAPRSAPSRCRRARECGPRRACFSADWRRPACRERHRCTASPATTASPRSLAARQERTTQAGGRLPAGLPDRVRRRAAAGGARPGCRRVPPDRSAAGGDNHADDRGRLRRRRNSARTRRTARRRPARRPCRSPPPRSGSRRCRPPPDTRGSPLTCPRSAPHNHPGPAAMTAVALSRRPARVLRLEIRRSAVPWAVSALGATP